MKPATRAIGSALHLKLFLCGAVVCAAWLALGLPLHGAEDLTLSFEQANKLYEQGKFTAAASAYAQLAQGNRGSAALFYNLGNAWFKAGQNGRAIAAYRHAMALSPRDPNVRFNLQFVRRNVTGSDSPPASWWQRSLAKLTLNEWSLLTAAALWGWFGLLSAREAWPNLRRSLAGYTALAGFVTLLLGGCLALASHEKFFTTTAIVVVPDAIVRNGPLDDSPVAYQLRDGSEVIVVDQIEVSDKASAFAESTRQTWLQVQGKGRRVGWLKQDQVVVSRD